MIKTEKLVVGQMKTNCYLVYDTKNLDCLIVDPGDDAEFIIQKIIDLELNPNLIIATHGHFDHIQAVNELKLAFKIDFWMSKKDEFLLKRMRNSAIYFTKLDPGPGSVIDELLDANSELLIANSKIKIIEIPGHTPGSVAVYLPEAGLLFSGDTLFAGGEIGGSDYNYSNKLELHKSIKIILKLPIETVIYPGHGESGIIRFERIFHKSS